jgi:AhpD family alkylhydroperoxidase
VARAETTASVEPRTEALMDRIRTTEGRRETPMPTVRIIDDDEATGTVRAVFDEFKKVRQTDRIPLFWRALAAKPAYLEAYWQRYKSLMLEGTLDRRTKEIIAFTVAVTQDSKYSIGRHTEALRKLGLDDEAIVEICLVIEMFKGSTAIPDGLLFDRDDEGRS